MTNRFDISLTKPYPPGPGATPDDSFLSDCLDFLLALFAWIQYLAQVAAFLPALLAGIILDDALPLTVFRAKGLVHFDAQPQGYVFRLCGGRAAFERFDGIFEGVRLVFIGQHVDAVSLERDVRACLTTACN